MSWNDPDEMPFFLAAMQGKPFDREAYRRVLEHKDPIRASLLALLIRQERPDAIDDPDLRATIAELREQVDEMWFRCVTSGYVLGCGDAPAKRGTIRFGYECPRTWAELQPTGEPAVRRCEHCAEAVHDCATLDEAAAHARAGRCISVRGTLADQLNRSVEDRMRRVTGRPRAPRFWAERVFEED
jgi:hypothetical protein